MSVGDQPRIDVRVSDAEREHAVALLQGHHAAGRLSLDEFSERVDEAYRARTTSDLDHALRELPFDRQPRPAPRRSWWRVRGLPGWWLRVNGICTTIWVITAIGGKAYYFWPAWVMFGTGIPVLMSAGHGRRHHHSRHDRSNMPPQSPPDLSSRTGRVVSSVLFIDVVESTARAAASGDSEWNRLLGEYERQVREEVTRYGGHEVFTKGDEVVAAFPTPAAAVKAGQDIRSRAEHLGLEVRAGVHAGEVDQQGREMRGLAMHIGQRVCAAAEPGQILVSSTVRDLLAGSSLAFTDAGEHELKGLPGPWRLFAVTA